MSAAARDTGVRRVSVTEGLGHNDKGLSVGHGVGGSFQPGSPPEEQILTPPTRTRLLAQLNAGIPTIFIEGGAGTHKSALLRSWAAQTNAQLRVLAEFDRRQLAATSMARQLAYQLELAGAGDDAGPLGDELAENADAPWSALAEIIERAVAGLDRPLALGVERLDELPSDAAQVLIELTASLPGFRLVGSAVDAQALTAQAVVSGVSHLVIGDPQLAYTPVEVAAILADALPEATEATVRTILDATHGIPALVERVIELFGQECLAGTVGMDQAVAGWLPHTLGADGFENQLRLLAQAPRFGPALLTTLFGEERAEYLFARLPRMGTGSVAQPLSGRQVFTWYPAFRRRLLQVGAVDDAEALAEDRLRIATAALAVGDAELALAMLVAAQALAEADQLCSRWLWELADADPEVLVEHFVALDPQIFRHYPNLLAVATLAQPGRGEPPADPELAGVQRAVLASSISGDVPEQLHRLSTAATLALGTGDLGIAIRAGVRWANLLIARVDEWQDSLDPSLVSDGLLMVKALVQLDRVDLVPQVAQVLLSPMRREPDCVGGEGDRRLSTLFATLRMAIVFLGAARSEVRALELGPRQFHREFDHVLHAVIDAGEALDRGDCTSAEAFTRVAMFRLQHPGDWPVLLYLRVAALVALADRAQLDELIDQVFLSARWEAWQHHREAHSFYGLLAEAMAMAATGRVIHRPLAELPAHNRSLPPGALHRWPSWGRRLMEGTLQLGTGAARSPELPTDAELSPLPPRISWQLGLITAVNNLRSGEEATAVSVVIRGGAPLKYPAAPMPLVLAAPDEIAVLNDRLPSTASLTVRSSLVLARAYAGIDLDSRGSVRLGARELEVLDGVRRGMTNTAIARELYVSVNTVKFHRTNLYRKLNATSREELLAEALRQGL